MPVGLRMLFAAAMIRTLLAAPCNIDLTSKGFPQCYQACEMWCWATVIGEFEEYYNNLNVLRDDPYGPVTPKCRKSECTVVSDTFGTNCCGNSTPAGCMTAHKPCGEGLTAELIAQRLQIRVPAAGKWQYHKGIPDEQLIISILSAGYPIATLHPGHINAVVGCRSNKDATEYRLVDSTGPFPAEGLWFPNYTMMMKTPWAPDAAVEGVIYATKQDAEVII